jgi:two-component system response regulator FixJ
MTRHVYIVDDDDAVRASLQSLLSTQPNMLCGGFRSGDAFVAEMAELEPGIVLLDIHMPGASGLEILRILREADAPHVPIIITGQGNIALAVQAMKGGAIDFLEKPYDHLALLEIVERAFAQLEKANGQVARQQSARERIDTLSARERDVLMGLIAGRANKVIAFELDISPRTVEIYRANLMAKLEVRNLSEALRVAFAAGLLADH